jgi:hypothetical protein
LCNAAAFGGSGEAGSVGDGEKVPDLFDCHRCYLLESLFL